MKKKPCFKAYLTVITIILMFFVSGVVMAATPKVVLDGKQLSFDVSPIIENGRVLVPMRAIFEALGATVSWDNETQVAVASKGGIWVAVQISSSIAVKNNVQIKLDVSPKIVRGRTMVPLRFVSESFGSDINWNQSNQTVSITNPQEVSLSQTELEKKVLAQYKQEKGSSVNVTAKAKDYGCHTQIDIIDSKGNIVRSYGYRGGEIYIID